MKNLHKVLFGAALAASLSIVHNGSAQSQMSGPGGIAASPRVRAMLEGRASSSVAAMPVVTISYRNPAEGLTASPKLREMLAGQKVVVGAAPSQIVAAGYRATGTDGVSASPKLRSQMDERSQPITIAPLK